MAVVRHLGFSKNLFLVNGLPLPADFPLPLQIWCINADPRPNYGPKTKFKMAADLILNLLPVAILTQFRLYTIDLNQHTEFDANISIHD